MNENYDLTRARIFIEQRSRIEGEHIIWTGYINEDGYGETSVYNKTREEWRRPTAHRVVLAISSKLDLDNPEIEGCHTCNRKDCIREEHLYAGSHQDNIDDRENVYIKHGNGKVKLGGICPHGHELKNIDDIRKSNRGIFYCRICDRERANKHYWEKKNKGYISA